MSTRARRKSPKKHVVMLKDPRFKKGYYVRGVGLPDSPDDSEAFFKSRYEDSIEDEDNTLFFLRAHVDNLEEAMDSVKASPKVRSQITRTLNVYRREIEVTEKRQKLNRARLRSFG